MLTENSIELCLELVALSGHRYSLPQCHVTPVQKSDWLKVLFLSLQWILHGIQQSAGLCISQPFTLPLSVSQPSSTGQQCGELSSFHSESGNEARCVSYPHSILDLGMRLGDVILIPFWVWERG